MLPKGGIILKIQSVEVKNLERKTSCACLHTSISFLILVSYAFQIYEIYGQMASKKLKDLVENQCVQLFSLAS
jgi:hypothetical protein